MCNPRRVMIHLNETIEQAWRTTVQEVATREGEVQELARLAADIPLGAEMGDRPLEHFERLLRGEVEGYQPWQRDEAGDYRRELGDVTLVYQPGSHQLMVEARLSERISAGARASAEASGFTVGEVAVEAVGRYYDDGWGGYTEERARQLAEAAADERLSEAIEALHREQNAAQLAQAEAEARAAAEEQAEALLSTRRAEVRAALRQRLQATLHEAREQVSHTMNRLVGEAYRQTLIQLVHENGGQIISDERSGSVINLELEFL